MARRAIFIDKDGTLIPDIPYNVDPDRVTLCPGAGQTLRWLQDKGFLLILASNQSGIARGMFTVQELEPINERLKRLLWGFGVSLAAFYYCPHLPEGIVPHYAFECECRKPKPGMLIQAGQDLGIDLLHSWLIGDIATDCEAGKQAGCQTILIDKMDDPQSNFNQRNQPDFIVHDWRSAGQIILSASRRLDSSYWARIYSISA